MLFFWAGNKHITFNGSRYAKRISYSRNYGRDIVLHWEIWISSYNKCVLPKRSVCHPATVIVRRKTNGHGLKLIFILYYHFILHCTCYDAAKPKPQFFHTYYSIYYKKSRFIYVFLLACRWCDLFIWIDYNSNQHKHFHHIDNSEISMILFSHVRLVSIFILFEQEFWSNESEMRL